MMTGEHYALLDGSISVMMIMQVMSVSGIAGTCRCSVTEVWAVACRTIVCLLICVVQVTWPGHAIWTGIVVTKYLDGSSLLHIWS